MTPVLPIWYTHPQRPSAINRIGQDGRVWRVTVIVPTRNEAANLRPVLELAAPFADEMLVVDGHSSDSTRQIAEEVGATVVLDNGKGKGDALRIGMKRASGDVLVFVDADGSHDPRDIPALVQPIIDGHADHVSGSRMLGGSDELHATLHQFVRLFGSQIITLSVNYTQNVRLTDCQNGFRAIRKDVALALDLQEDITTIEQEMVIKSVRLGYRLGEVATHEYVRANGESNFRVLDVWPHYVRSWLYYLLFWRPQRAQIEASTQRRKEAEAQTEESLPQRRRDAEANALPVSAPERNG